MKNLIPKAYRGRMIKAAIESSKNNPSNKALNGSYRRWPYNPMPSMFDPIAKKYPNTILNEVEWPS